MLLAELAATSRALQETSGRNDKIARLADLLRRLAPDEVTAGASWLTGELRQGRFGLGPAVVRAAAAVPAAAAPSLTVAEVDAAFAALAAARGAGSQARRAELLGALLARATAAERDLLLGLIAGELRQGALEGVMTEAIARAAGVPAAAVRRAAMLRGDLGVIAAAALAGGAAGLAEFRIQLLRPVQPMLAQTAETVTEALDGGGELAFEDKLDGARVQLHKAGAEVRVFSRGLRDVTAALPELVELATALPARELVVDGEALALRGDGAPQPFQVSMRRFGRKLDVARLRAELPMHGFFFDCLYLDGASLLEASGAERLAALAAAVPAAYQVRRLVTAEPERAEAFLAAALAAGHEGVMAKSLAAPYEAGSRGRAWRKLKPATTLDLVVLAAEWGHGRRRGFLSNLHLGARDPAGGGFVMLGKTFKGMTDEMLAWQTEHLLGLATERDAWVVPVRPELVVEVAFHELQASPHYPGGLALRFARIKRYRTDKRAADADTIDTVRDLHQRRSARAGAD